MEQTENNVSIIEIVLAMIDSKQKPNSNLIRFKRDEYRSQYQKVIAEYRKEKKI